MFDTLRRQLDDAYRAQDSGMSAGLPNYVELSHDKVRLQRDDYIRRARKLLED